MSADVDAVVSALLYEGYLLWPYRRSAKKNRRRWTFGGCYPRRFSETAGTNDPWWRQTECLVAGANPTVDVTVRFLQVVRRQVWMALPDGRFEPVDALHIGDEHVLSWDEAIERSHVTPRVRLGEGTETSAPIQVSDGGSDDIVLDRDGKEAGRIARRWHALEGQVTTACVPVAPGLFRLQVRVSNTTAWNGEHREAVQPLAFVSTHVLLSVKGGRFVSLLDPPDEWRAAAEQCHNVGTWPVLVGASGTQETMLSSPIILYDYPAVAPESPGDLFDATEIDELLTLNVLALTDEEKEEMRHSDPRGRAILSRTEALNGDGLMRLHGAVREGGPWGPVEIGPPREVRATGGLLAKGTRVRLHPRPGGDLWGSILAGKTALVEAIEQDFENRVHVAVSIEEDPGRDLADVSPGHRFFFAPDELEVLAEQESGAPAHGRVT